jgi:hypothetical protein
VRTSSPMCFTSFTITGGTRWEWVGQMANKYGVTHAVFRHSANSNQNYIEILPHPS